MCKPISPRFNPAFLAAGVCFLSAALSGAQEAFFGIGAAFIGLAIGPLFRRRRPL